ncbi:MAG TPA: hypothetical protein VF292_01195 [Rhodanobacteraceae bacterium]
MDGGTNIVQFVPRADVDARENLAEFIRIARDELTAFAEGGAWDSDRWQQGETVVVFATKTQPLTPYRFTPLADPFKQFAKAYVRYEYSHEPVDSVAYWIQALRCIEAALLQVHGRAEVGLLSLAVMDVSAAKCKEFYRSEDGWHKTGLAAARVFDFCREHGLVRSLPSWQSPFPKPTILTEDLGEAGKAHREAKLPSNASMLALAELFCRADDKESQFFSSIMVLLMVAPGRISEVLRLPVDCIGLEPDDRGEPQMYLRWWAAKGKGFTKKWIVPAMRDVVSEAVRRLTEIGAPARAAAQFAYEHPGEFLGHERGLARAGDVDDTPVSPEAFCAAMGLSPHVALRNADGTARWSALTANTKWIARLVSGGGVTYGQLAEFTHRKYGGRNWPFIDEGHAVHAWDALCLHRDNEFHHDFAVKPFSWRLPGATEVNSRLEQSCGRSLFARYGLRNPDGSPIRLTSHQPRHWLSTMSERAGMDDYTLAQWAGRARIADNRHYDHRTPEERSHDARSLVLPQTAGLLQRVKNREPVTYQELGVDRPGAAKPTLYGFCVHDYSMTPCTKLRQCMTCKLHVCIKGDFVTLDRIKRLEDQLQFALERAEEAHEEGKFGADRWVDHFKWELGHTRTMRIMLERPDIPDGTPLRIPDAHDPSPVQRAMINLGFLAAPSADQAELPVEIKPLPGVAGA